MGNRLFKYAISLGVGSGTTTVELNPDDLSRLASLQGDLQITAAATDATDTLIVKVQNTFDRISWDTVMRFTTVLGNVSASATAPYVERLSVQQRVGLDPPEEAHLETGSATGTELAAGSVRNGPFPPGYRDVNGRAASWRVLLVRVDAGTQNLAFTGQLYLSGSPEA